MPTNVTADQLFRFMAVVPPRAVNTRLTRVPVMGERAAAMSKALAEGQRDNAVGIAKDLVGDQDVVDVGTLENESRLSDFASELERSDGGSDAVKDAVRSAFGRRSDDWRPSVEADLAAVADRLAAAQLVADPSERLVSAAKLLRTALFVADGIDVQPDEVDAPVVLWDKPASTRNTVREPRTETPPPPSKAPSASAIAAAVGELQGLEREARQWVAPPLVVTTEVDPQAPPSATTLAPLAALLGAHSRNLGLTLVSPTAAAPPSLPDNVTPVEDNGGPSLAEVEERTAAIRAKVSDGTRAVAKALKVSMEGTMWQVANRIEAASLTLPPDAPRGIVYPGGPVIDLGDRTHLLPDGLLDFPALDVFHVPKVRPVGWGKLMRVVQQISRYEAGEVAHIENVLQGESRGRTHRVLDRTTLVEEQETQREEHEEHEISSTERYELQRETQQALDEETKLHGSVDVKGSYGPTVDFAVSASADWARREQESERSATTFAREVVDRAVERVTSKVREKRSSTTMKEVEERTEHAVDNTAGEGHVTGIYRWVDKVYIAQTRQYGDRLLFDVIVPEPARNLRHLLVQHAVIEDTMPPLEPFTLTPGEVTIGNYRAKAAMYGASDVPNPPEPYVVSATTIFGETEDERYNRVVAGETLTIPTGYQAVEAAVGFESSYSYEDRWFDLWIGRTKFAFKYFTHSARIEMRTWQGVQPLHDQRGTIPIAHHGGNLKSYMAAVEVLCERTPEALAEWQMKAWTSIHDAYQQRLAERRDARTRAELSQGIGPEGENPAINAQRIAGELQRAALEEMMGAPVAHQDAYRDTAEGPVTWPGTSRSNAARVRFLEHAIEWPQMSYVLYPYFWASRDRWAELTAGKDDDPQYRAFLEAGAARVVIPVRLGFEQALLHFLETGRTWDGTNDPPDVTSDLYLPIVQEIRERQGQFDVDEPVGEPWEVRVPTSLVLLQSGPELPRWEQGEDGTWRPA